MALALEWTLAYFGLLLQIITGLLLWRLDLQPRMVLRLFAFLFFLNAGVSALMFLPQGDGLWLRSDSGWVTRVFRALDAPTGPLLLALLAARSPRRGAWWLTRALIAAGAVHAVVEILFHEAVVPYDSYIRSLPFYAGLGLASWVLAGGSSWERWVALALLPRGLYWGTAGLNAVGNGLATHHVALLVNDIGLLLLFVLSAAAAARLFIAEGQPAIAVALPFLLIGPAASFLESLLSGTMPPGIPFRYGTYVMINFLTLGLVRPVVALIGLAPSELKDATLRAAGAALVGWFAMTVFSPVVQVGDVLGDAARFGFGLCVSLLVLATWEGVRHQRRSLPEAPRTLIGGAHASSLAPSSGVFQEMATAEPARLTPAFSRAQTAAFSSGSGVMMDLPLRPSLEEGAPSQHDRPQWQSILLALRGSCVSERGSLQGEPRLTQKELVAQTGISAPRVSMLTRILEQSPAGHLDQHLPEWRDLIAKGGDPAVVRRYEGMVAGWSGIWVYYRLTPLGEHLVASLASGPSHD